MGLDVGRRELERPTDLKTWIPTDHGLNLMRFLTVFFSFSGSGGRLKVKIASEKP